MKSNVDKETNKIELGDSDFANKLEVVANAAVSKAIPGYAKVIIIIMALMNLIGVPTLGALFIDSARDCIQEIRAK